MRVVGRRREEEEVVVVVMVMEVITYYAAVIPCFSGGGWIWVEGVEGVDGGVGVGGGGVGVGGGSVGSGLVMLWLGRWKDESDEAVKVVE
jgi:hypothetical protein